jgi:hypothetical protein
MNHIVIVDLCQGEAENLTSGQKTRLKKYIDQIIEEFG